MAHMTVPKKNSYECVTERVEVVMYSNLKFIIVTQEEYEEEEQEEEEKENKADRNKREEAGRDAQPRG